MLFSSLVICNISHALPEDAEQPINITADDLQIDQVRNRATYTGNVAVDQGTLKVTAEQMVVEYENQQVVRIIAEGTPAYYKQQINAEEEQVNANADLIVYHTAEDRIDLEGEAFLTQRGNEIRGEIIKYDMVAAKVKAYSDQKQSDQKKSRVEMKLQPARPKK